MIRSPDAVFASLWNTYFKGQLSRLAGHQVANFVVAKSIERLDTTTLVDTFGEMKPFLGRIFGTLGLLLDPSFTKALFSESARTGILRAVIDRCATLGIDALAKDIYEVRVLHGPAPDD